MLRSDFELHFMLEVHWMLGAKYFHSNLFQQVSCKIILELLEGEGRIKKTNKYNGLFASRYTCCIVFICCIVRLFWEPIPGCIPEILGRLFQNKRFEVASC